MAKVVGQRRQHSTPVHFYHPACGELVVYTGIDQISWGYTMNTANFPTYGGEVIQILSCYVDDLQMQGTLHDYKEMQTVYDYFLKFIDNAGGANSVDEHGQRIRDERPMKFTYPHRNWVFDIFVKEAPGYRRGRDVVAPTWQITGHVVDHAGDAKKLSDLIVKEAEFKSLTSGEAFDLEGKIRYQDEDPFSDPWTDTGPNFSVLDKQTDQFAKLLPSYLKGDFDLIFAGVGSKPAFNPQFGLDKRGGSDKDETTRRAIEVATKKDR